MANILVSSNAAPLNSVLICCTSITTTFNISSRARTDWPVGVKPQGPWVPLPLDVSEAAAVPLPFLGAPPRGTRLEWGGWNIAPHLLQSPANSFSASPTSRVYSPDNWRDEAFLLPPTGSCSMLAWKMYFLSRGTPCAGARLLVVCPDVVEMLAVMALRKTILSSICLYPDCYVTEAWQSEHFLGFCRPRKDY
jgi:hypothetical protein